MSTDYSYMNEWTDEKVEAFKEQGEGLQSDALEGVVGASGAIEDVGTIVAEGDSWFDYPVGTDIVDCLRNHFSYRIEKEADAGDTLENMIYGTRITRDFDLRPPSIKKVLRKIERFKPKIFLFSGGGNDIAGDEFGSFLNHVESDLPHVRIDYVNHMINVVFRKCYEDLIAKVASVSSATRIIAHGYGHTIPTGKGVGIIFNFSGPWLRPALAMKGIVNPEDQKLAVSIMIDTYNEMLADIDQSFDNFHYVDLRPIVDPLTDWSNELHLRNGAYAKVAEKFHETISALIAT